MICWAHTIKKMNLLAKTLGYDLEGERLVFLGKVFDFVCEQVEVAVLDFWQADNYRTYDDLGYTLRGKVKMIRNSTIFLIQLSLNNIPKVVLHALVTFL